MLLIAVFLCLANWQASPTSVALRPGKTVSLGQALSSYKAAVPMPSDGAPLSNQSMGICGLSPWGWYSICTGETFDVGTLDGVGAFLRYVRNPVRASELRTLVSLAKIAYGTPDKTSSFSSEYMDILSWQVGTNQVVLRARHSPWSLSYDIAIGRPRTLRILRLSTDFGDVDQVWEHYYASSFAAPIEYSIPNFERNCFAQKDSRLCWAACLSAIFQHFKQQFAQMLTQEQIASENGRPANNEEASVEDVMRILNKPRLTPSGFRWGFSFRRYSPFPSPEMFVGLGGLTSPLIVFLSDHHAVLIYGIRLKRSRLIEIPQITDVHVYDPLKDTHVWESWPTFNERITDIIAISGVGGF